jgi:hypothetical protein
VDEAVARRGEYGFLVATRSLDIEADTYPDIKAVLFFL